MKACGHGDPEGICGLESGFTQRAFRGDIDGIRAALEPAGAQFKGLGQADSDFLVAGQGNRGDAGFPLLGGEAGVDDMHPMPALPQAMGKASQSHGHSIHIGKEGVGNNVDFHDHE